MTYKSLVKLVESICLEMPNIRTFVEGDVYTLNSITPTYIVTCLTLQNRRDLNGFSYYTVYLFYVDRLKKDLSNDQEIISSGIDAMSKIIDKIKFSDGVFWDETYAVTMTPFHERFSDECSGIMATLTIPVIKENECE